MSSTTARGPTSDTELDSIIGRGGRQGDLYAKLRTIRDRYAGLIRAKFPDIPRRVSGYNLDQLLPEHGFNVARALVEKGAMLADIDFSVTCHLPSAPARAVCV